MVDYWCEDLKLRIFRESWKRYCSLFLLLLYQINVILTISGCWLLQNLEKRKKSNKFNRFQIGVFFLSNIPPPPPYISCSEYKPIEFTFCPYIHPGRINRILRYNAKQSICFEYKKLVARFDKKIVACQKKSTEDPREESITEDPEEESFTENSKRTLSMKTLSLRNLKDSIIVKPQENLINEDP